MSEIGEISGLSASEVLDSRLKHGVNILTPPKKEPLWRQFLGKFRDPLIIILLIAGVLSIGISLYEYYGLDGGAAVFFEPLGIFIAIILATGLAFIFELKADKEFALLNQVNDEERVQVVRDGNATSVARRDVVVGDIVILSTGEEIPADGQLLQAISLSVDESSLTGEPIARKTTDPAHFDHEATFPSDMAMRGTRIMEGHGVMRVTAVGDSTENGRVMEASRIDDSVKTPLDEQLERLGALVARFSYAIAALILIGRTSLFLLHEPFDWIPFLAYFLQTVMIAVTLIVVSVPEGLPMAVTLALAYSMRRMLRTNNLVRKLHACETMGATTVICTDKTGTLTQNRMTLAHADFFGNPPESVILDSMAVNTTAMLDMTDPESPAVLGNPTEGALLLWLLSRGEDYRARRAAVTVTAELSFSTERKYMATIARHPDGTERIYVKGAPEIVFSMCGTTEGTDRARLDALLQGYQAQAMRTLGFAWADLPADSAGEELSAEERISRTIASGALRFLGVTAISDPVREDVPDAVAQVRGAGIEIKIVTGDTPGTAKEIGRQIGLWDDSRDGAEAITTGVEFAAMSDSEVARRVKDIKIIARARPMDKKRLVEALQAQGEVVAVTGDGTNDAPALKSAHVGLSMGDGTSVAKEASDITIIDNSFGSIGRAVLWGRSLYRNIQRFLLFQLTVNVAASLIVLLGAFMGMQSPLTVTQMLWVNLIMDTFAAVALASLPPTESVMNEPPRPRRAFIITKRMWRDILGVGLLFFVLLTGLLYYLQHTPLERVADILYILPGDACGLSPKRLSIFFTVFVFLQFWNLFNARSFETGRSAFHFRDCRAFLLIAALILSGQILIVECGGQFFNVVPLSAEDWLIIVGATSAVLLLPELGRLARRILR